MFTRINRASSSAMITEYQARADDVFKIFAMSLMDETVKEKTRHLVFTKIRKLQNLKFTTQK